ncbi:MFS transporter [Anaeromassilibacillus sp. SJQ-1]|uniref:MFS transporter n=1 Tax=Anaeromassilibacillus sp. SJQ-1 TaxID=3375419 RepID=UPI003988CC56
MQKRTIWLCYAIAFLQGLLFYAPISTLYRQTNGISIFEITLIESISLAVSLAMELPWGWIADRIGYRNTLVICHFLFFFRKFSSGEPTDSPGF